MTGIARWICCFKVGHLADDDGEYGHYEDVRGFRGGGSTSNARSEDRKAEDSMLYQAMDGELPGARSLL